MLLPVKDALERVLAAAKTVSTVEKPLSGCHGYSLSKDIMAKRTQPPFASSAMDGYAVRHDDLKKDIFLTVIGESSAGHGYNGKVCEGETVRTFTGAPMPEGTDTVLIQEDAEKITDTEIKPTDIPAKGLFVRPEGMDFRSGQILLNKGTVLNFQSLSLAAAMNHPTLNVHRKPKVGILSNGDELVWPGQEPDRDQIIASNAFGVASLVQEFGGEAIDLGIASDKAEDIDHAFTQAQKENCDVLVTLGGASVGDHDLIKPALKARGAALDFWKIAMRPGKPFMFGNLEDLLILGMPGNPVSSLVCSLLFLRPLVLAMQNRDPTAKLVDAVLAKDVAANGIREGYLRSMLEVKDGKYLVTAFDQQDSSILTVLAKANCLLIRPIKAPAAKAGEPCKVMLI